MNFYDTKKNDGKNHEKHAKIIVMFDNY